MRPTRIFTAAIVVGIATTRLIETLKEAIPFIPPPAYKSTLASALAGTAGAALVDDDWRGRALAGAGAAGIAMITHVMTDLASVTADRQKVHVMRAAATR